MGKRDQVIDWMKIAWFTPFPPEKSAIAEYSTVIVNELQKNCEIDLWVALHESEDLELTENKYSKYMKIVNYYRNPGYLNSLSSYDSIVYNMGNNLKFHKDIFECSKVYPGIVILHDYVLHHFFAAYHLSFKNSKEDYIKDMEKNHGTDGKKLAQDILSGKVPRVWETEEVIHYPLNRSVLENVEGIVVHSNFVKNKLREYAPLPIRAIPFPNPPAIDSQVKINKEALNISPDKILIVTFGEINPNKRIEKVLKVLGENSILKKNVIYVLIGKEDRNYYDLRPMIKKYNLNDSVRILGYQPKQILNEFILASDICVNMRYPTMGESSWSLIQVLLGGKPAIVTKTGWYDELPDDCVVKINPQREEEELLLHITKLCHDDNLRRKIGQRACHFAKDNFSTEKYCEKIIDFINHVRKCRVVTNLIDRVSWELSLMGILDDFTLVDDVAREIYYMCAHSE